MELSGVLPTVMTVVLTGRMTRIIPIYQNPLLVQSSQSTIELSVNGY